METKQNGFYLRLVCIECIDEKKKGCFIVGGLYPSTFRSDKKNCLLIISNTPTWYYTLTDDNHR